MLNNLALFHVCVWWGWKIVEEQYAIMQLQKILQPAFAIALCKLHRGNFCDSRAQPPSDWRQPYLLFVCILGMIGDALGKNGNWKFPQGRHKKVGPFYQSTTNTTHQTTLWIRMKKCRKRRKCQQIQKCRQMPKNCPKKARNAKNPTKNT